MIESFNYKQKKSIIFWLIDKNNYFLKEKKDNFFIKIDYKEYNFFLKENIYGEKLENINNLHEILLKLNLFLKIIFAYEKYHDYWFSYSFYKIERKKLGLKRVAENELKDKIWRKYLKQYLNYENNISILWEFLNQEENSLVRISNIVRTIRYIKWDLEKIHECLNNYEYKWNNKNKKINLSNFLNFIKDNDFFELLNFYSKTDTEQKEEYKIALNPAILNTHNEINKANFENETKILEKEIKKLDEENNKNKETKRNFEQDLEAYINYILYEKNFFKKSTNSEYKEKTKIIYEKYKYYIENKKWQEIKEHERFTLEFIRKNRIELNHFYILEDEIIQSYSEQKNEVNSLTKIISNKVPLKDKNWNIILDKNSNEIKIYEINFVQLKTLLYILTWKRAEIKDGNKKSETEKKEFGRLSEYIKALKWEINARLNNQETLYWKFIAPPPKKEEKTLWKKEWYKSKIARKLWQKDSEYIQKLNFNNELKTYSHFWFIIRKWDRFFIKPYKKEEILNDNQWFTLENAKNLIKNNIDRNWEYKTFVFQSLTLKWLLKLIFIKNAFNKNFSSARIDPETKEKYKAWENNKEYEIWKRKTYYENSYDSEIFIKFLINILESKKALKLFPFIKNNFKKYKEYKNFYDFEKDLLKNAYTINTYKCNFEEKELIELDITDRKFEYCENKVPRLKRQNDIKLFVKWFFDKTNNEKFDIIRLLPEIKIFIRYKRYEQEIRKRIVKWKDCNEQIINKKIDEKERFYKDVIKAAFNLELNPLWIGNNPNEEKQSYLKNIIRKFKSNEKFFITAIDIWENEFATCWVYDRNLKPQKIEVIWENDDKVIKDLTDLKIEKWKIIKKGYKNSEKYKEYKYMFEQITLWQIYLKDILDNIWEIKIEKQKFNEIKLKISNSVQKVSEIPNFNWSTKYITKYFPKVKTWLKDFLLNFFKNNYENQEVDCKEQSIYNEIFKNLELQKVIDFKAAFGSNFVWVIKKIIKDYPWIIVFESLHTWNSLGWCNEITGKRLENTTSKKLNEIKKFWTYVWMYIVKALFNKFSKDIDEENFDKVNQYVFFDKNYENSIIEDTEKKYHSNGIIFFVNEDSTSSACPVCNPKLYNVNNIYKLYWHWEWKEKEKSMHHINNINDKNGENYQEWKWKSWELESWDLCDFHIWYNKKYPDFSFIKSWDDLATYNIAKRALEYLEYLESQNNDKTK